MKRSTVHIALLGHEGSGKADLIQQLLGLELPGQLNRNRPDFTIRLDITPGNLLFSCRITAFRALHEDITWDDDSSEVLDSRHVYGSDVEHKVTVAAFARRRLPVVMTRLRMYENVQAGIKFIEQGHIRVGPEVVTDPAYLVTRNIEDYVTWVDSSKIKRNILKYRDKVDDFDLL